MGCAIAPTAQYLVFGNLTGNIPQCNSSGNASGTAGIQFSPPSTQSPSGTFSFAQLVRSDAITYTVSGSTSTTCPGTPGLDGAYPYQNKYGQLVNDAPYVKLFSTYTTESRSFVATMYLMWQSSTPSSIPIPLGYVDWNFSGSSSEPLPNSTWGPATVSGIAASFVPVTSPGLFPTWGGLAVPPGSPTGSGGCN